MSGIADAHYYKMKYQHLGSLRTSDVGDQHVGVEHGEEGDVLVLNDEGVQCVGVGRPGHAGRGVQQLESFCVIL